MYERTYGYLYETLGHYQAGAEGRPVMAQPKRKTTKTRKTCKHPLRFFSRCRNCPLRAKR